MGVILHQTTDISFLRDIEEGLDAYNLRHIGKSRQPVYLKLQDDDKTLGGMRAHALGSHFFISWLFVDPSLQGQGWGRKIMLRAEEIAKDMGCVRSFVDTLSFQAPEFYKSLGYAEIGRVDGYIDTHDRIFFRKEFS